ncbi:hypothetical protein RUM44_002896 [Polyplax serrata]|uniref:Uncharacterized protein n=1 Tax=Polyplax serrata TaxID=468196 RepID=A0ABR1AXM6_POLSC
MSPSGCEPANHRHGKENCKTVANTNCILLDIRFERKTSTKKGVSLLLANSFGTREVASLLEFFAFRPIQIYVLTLKLSSDENSILSSLKKSLDFEGTDSVSYTKCVAAVELSLLKFLKEEVVESRDKDEQK